VQSSASVKVIHCSATGFDAVAAKAQRRVESRFRVQDGRLYRALSARAASSTVQNWPVARSSFSAARHAERDNFKPCTRWLKDSALCCWCFRDAAG